MIRPYYFTTFHLYYVYVYQRLFEPNTNQIDIECINNETYVNNKY